MAKKNEQAKTSSSARTNIMNNRTWQLALFGGAALGALGYLQSRSRKKVSLNMPEPALPVSEDSPSQTGQWSAKPPESELHLPEKQKVEPDTMPGPTETLTRTIYQRY